MVMALAKNGVRDVVASPGSRNAPLTMALATQSAISLQMRFDERSAAFTALGIAKATRRPVAVIVTSGTAVANLTPAVYEAHESGVPLILITADRPPAVRGRGANQTIEQFGLFSLAVRAEWDLPLAADRAEQYWELAIANAVTESMGDAFTAPGPVHLNVPFAEPLVPDLADFEWNPIITVGTAPTIKPTDTVELLPLLKDLGLHDREVKGVVITSDPAAARPLIALARLLQWPVLAEPGSGAREEEVGIQHYSKLLSDSEFFENHRADLVLTAGRFGLSRAVVNFVKNTAHHIAIGRYPLDADPFETAQHHVAQVPLPIGVQPAPTDWLQSWQTADREIAGRDTEWNSRTAVARLIDSLPEDSQLFIAASQSVRLVDDLLPLNRSDLQCFVNRGANGIDGLIASAQGVAFAQPEKPTWLVLGDVATLHDLSSLGLPMGAPKSNLRVLVLDNNGGAIFRHLEQGAEEFASVFDRVFGTSHSADLAKIASGLGWKSTQVNDEMTLVNSLLSDSDFIVAKVPDGM